MLVKCPECSGKASDQAPMCPHCGYPMKADKPIIVRRSNRKRRLPNGFGQISEIKQGNLRKPFRVMVPAGKAPNGRPISKPLKPTAYFETYNAAYTALVEYHKNPYDIDASTVTIGELYERWSREHYNIVSADTVKNYKSTWKYCESIQNMNLLSVRKPDLVKCIVESTRIKNNRVEPTTITTKKNIHNLLNMMYDFAVSSDMIEKNISRDLLLPSELVVAQQNLTHKHHIPFSDEELKILWDNQNASIFIQYVLIQTYMGWRPQEIGLLEVANINLEEGWIVGGMKTDAGRNRKVPIHSRVRPIVQKLYDEAIAKNNKYLCPKDQQFGSTTRPMSYDTYRRAFIKILEVYDFDPGHKPHDPRAHFVTMAKESNVNEYAIKYIIGHAIKDLTEDVYTTRSIEWLQSEIEKIK